ncbi:hypothetical protein, partial [Staphylococcus felis]
MTLKDIKHKLSGICLKIEKTKDPIPFQFENQKNNTIKKFIKSPLRFSVINHSYCLGSQSNWTGRIKLRRYAIMDCLTPFSLCDHKVLNI